MDDRNDMWRRESDSYREGGKLNPEGRGRTSNGSRFWQALAVACLVLLVVFAGIIA